MATDTPGLQTPAKLSEVHRITPLDGERRSDQVPRKDKTLERNLLRVEDIPFRGAGRLCPANY